MAQRGGGGALNSTLEPLAKQLFTEKDKEIFVSGRKKKQRENSKKKKIKENNFSE